VSQTECMHDRHTTSPIPFHHTSRCTQIVHGEHYMNNLNNAEAHLDTQVHGTDEWEIAMMRGYLRSERATVRAYAQRRIDTLKLRSA